MRTKSIITAIGAVLLTACDVKDPIYNTSHPEKGEVTVTTDWTATGITDPHLEGYTLKAGEYSKEVMKEENTFNEYFIPGDYMLYAYNEPDNITVDGTMTAITASNGYINPLPGWFYCGLLPITVEADSKHRFNVVMAQQVRELTLVIEPTGNTTDRITTITATLSGVAGSYDMENATHGTASVIRLTFTKQTTSEYAGKWAATVRLLGIVRDTEQKLSGTITFTGGIPTNLPLESDLTGSLATFNNDKTEMLTLAGEVETRTGVGFTATITDWMVVDNGQIEVN